MHFAEFIERDMEIILSAWEGFALSLPPGRLQVGTMRDHAQGILRAVCKDVVLAHTRGPHTFGHQHPKLKGPAPTLDARETAAQQYALLRARGGFDINEMAAEYRALRSSVLRLWADACAPAVPDLEELIRFNEAIDQALCESIQQFSKEADRARDLLLGIIGHDMRDPLHSIQLNAKYLHGLNAGDRVTAASDRLIRCGSRMTALLEDLTDFNRTRLGLGIPIRPGITELAQVFEDELEHQRASHPERQITLKLQGLLRGTWDANRIHQVLGNLVVNALRYGSKDGAVHVELTGLESEVVFTVENEGDEITDSTFATMFDPLARGEERMDPEQGLGLGLYICREIARAHGGSIKAESGRAGTVFEVRLPRNPPPSLPTPAAKAAMNGNSRGPVAAYLSNAGHADAGLRSPNL